MNVALNGRGTVGGEVGLVRKDLLCVCVCVCVCVYIYMYISMCT